MTADATPGPVDLLREAVREAAAALDDRDGHVQPPALERPPRAEFGDYSSNVAMLLAPSLKMAPRAIAEQIGERLEGSMGETVERVEVAGPGFLNVFLSDPWFTTALATILDQGDAFGGDVVEDSARERILLEFVSANPTGPITAASGRHAALGDSLARVLEFAGHAVEREYYINDYGTQIELFGQSIAAAMRGEDPPEGGYQGDYVRDLARQVGAEGLSPDDLDPVTRRGVELTLEQVSATLERFRVRFDTWRSQRELHDDGRVDDALEALGGDGHVYSSEGATWLRTTSFGDDKDRVLRRSSGELTYFASDIAYHKDKHLRGFDRLIDMVGADHHGYLGRLKAVFEALGGDPERLEPILVQLVNLVEHGERAQMSKRRGEYVTLDEVIDDIGVDATRFFMLQRSHETMLDLDLDLAREQSQENPVYYVQYAHARISSILRNAGEERLRRAQSADVRNVRLPLQPAERSLIKRLLELPAEVREAAERRAPHRLTTYAHEVASDFHTFYRDCLVVGAEPSELEDLRISACLATQRVIARTLDLLGVEAPDRM